MHGGKTQNGKVRDQNAGVENAEPENGGIGVVSAKTVVVFPGKGFMYLKYVVIIVKISTLMQITPLTHTYYHKIKSLKLQKLETTKTPE